MIFNNMKILIYAVFRFDIRDQYFKYDTKNDYYKYSTRGGDNNISKNRDFELSKSSNIFKNIESILKREKIFHIQDRGVEVEVDQEITD